MQRISPRALVHPRPSQWNVLLLAKEIPHMGAKPFQYWSRSHLYTTSFHFISLMDKNTPAPIIFPIFQKFPAVIDEPRVKLKMRLFVFKEMVKHGFKI